MIERFKTAAPVFALAIIASACTTTEVVDPPPPPPEDEILRSPLTVLGEFPAGPEFPVTGDRYRYAVDRTWDTTPGDGVVDQTQFGELVVRVMPDEPFGIWNRATPVISVQTLGTLADSSTAWYRLELSADTSATFAMIGDYRLESGTQELTEPRPVLHYPLTTPELGPDSVATWVEFQASVTRWMHGLRNIVVNYNIDILTQEPCEDAFGNPTICYDEEFSETIAAEVETFLVEDRWVTPTATAAESTWFGRYGLVKSVLASRTTEQTIVTTTRLTWLRVDQPDD